MKKLLLGLMLITSVTAQALIIQGEESKNHFIQIKKIHNSDKYSILECKGTSTDFNCEGLYPMPVPLSEDFILDMSRDKMIDMGVAIGADVLLFALAIKAYSIGFTASRLYYGAKGFSLEGVGTVGGILTAIPITPTAGTAPFIFDVLDPRTHYDLAQALNASISEKSSFDLQEEYEGINMKGNFELHSSPDNIKSAKSLLEVDNIATIDNLSTQDIINSFKKLISNHVREQNLPYEDLILGSGNSPAERILQKRMIGL